jgi:putative membrane protein
VGQRFEHQEQLPGSRFDDARKFEEDQQMKMVVSLAAACSLLTATASAQTKSPSAEEFVTKVAISDMMEIQSSELALARQPDTDTKPFAEQMIKDHQQTSKELKALIDAGKVKVTLPTTLDAEHQKKLAELKAKTGKDVDRAYDQMQMQAHEEAVMLFDAYANSGDNAELKAWAAKTLPRLKEHLAMAKKLS